MGDEVPISTQVKQNHRTQRVWSDNPNDCVKMSKKVHADDTVHFNITFSWRYVMATECPRGTSMDQFWFEETVLPDIAQALAEQHFQTEIDSRLQHDNCPP
jgi:hypothetical protein